MEQQTLLALRSDLALQIARAVGASGQTQTAAAASLQLPQPTLSRIINGRVEGLTVELLIRVAVRLRLPLSLQTGLDAREAGVFLASGPGPGPSPRLGQRLNPSKVADHAKLALLENIRRVHRPSDSRPLSNTTACLPRYARQARRRVDLRNPRRDLRWRASAERRCEPSAVMTRASS